MKQSLTSSAEGHQEASQATVSLPLEAANRSNFDYLQTVDQPSRP